MAYDPYQNNYGAGSNQPSQPSSGNQNYNTNNNYSPDWFSTPAGGVPPANWDSAEGFLKSFADIDVSGLDDESRVFLPDPGQMEQKIGQARSELGFGMQGQALTGRQNLLGMTGNQGLAGTMGGGFGRAQYGQQQAVGQARGAYESAVQQGVSGYKSDVLQEQYRYQDALTSALGNLIASGEAGDLTVTPGGFDSTGRTPNTTLPTWQPPDSPVYGDTYDDQGSTWYYDGSSWVSKDLFDQGDQDGDRSDDYFD